MSIPAPCVTPLDTVEKKLAHLYQAAPSLDQRVEDAVEALVETGVIPADRWRQFAHVAYCRAIYATHVRPLEAHLTFAEIANHLAELGVPRFRGSSDWSGEAITDIRAVVSSPDNQILLPDP